MLKQSFRMKWILYVSVIIFFYFHFSYLEMFNFYPFIFKKKRNTPSHTILGVGCNTDNWCDNVTKLQGQAT